MLDYRVDVRKLQVGIPVTGTTKTGPIAPKKVPAPADSTKKSVDLPPADSVQFSPISPPGAVVPEPAETPTQPVRFENVPQFHNGPLTMGMEPSYVKEIRVLDERYPGVADKLKGFEVEAATQGYCPVASKSLEASVLESPPWPTTSFGSARENIGAKAKELQAQNPELKSQDPSTYDFKSANRASDGLLETLDGMFPADKFPGLVMSTRAKAPASLAKKMEKQKARDGDFSMAHLTDTVGARIDAPNLESMGQVAKALEKQYEGKIVAKSDYVSQPGENGYRALHYIIDIGGRMAEIQTSTTSLRAADLATHDTVYKPEFPVSPEAKSELATAADRIMFLECLTAKGMR